MSWRRWLFVALSFSAAIGASLYIVISSWPQERAAVSFPWYAHLIAFSAWAMEIITRALKLQLSARAYGVPLRFTTSVRTSLGGDFGASITPSRSGAEPARFVILAEAGTPVTGTLLILYTELVLEALSIAVVGLALAVFLRGSGRVFGGLAGLVGGYSGFVLGAGVLVLLLSRRNASGPPPRWASAIGMTAWLWRKVQRLLRHTRDAVSAARRARRGMMLLALVFSVIHVLCRLTILPALVWASAPETPLAPLVLWPLALIFGGAVAPAPGGGGLIEVAYRAALGGTIPPAIFGASLIWWRFYTFYIYIPAGAIAAGGTALRALRGRGGAVDEIAEANGAG